VELRPSAQRQENARNIKINRDARGYGMVVLLTNAREESLSRFIDYVARIWNETARSMNETDARVVERTQA
jgi:hypothetical protein